MVNAARMILIVVSLAVGLSNIIVGFSTTGGFSYTAIGAACICAGIFQIRSFSASCESGDDRKGV